MPAPKGPGIADDGADYEDLSPSSAQSPKPPTTPRAPGPPSLPRSRGASTVRGIADDAAMFQDLVGETTDKARTLDSDWLYNKGGQVFGPIKPRELLELLYSGEIDAETPVALSEGDFQPLSRYGVFRVHLPKVAAHQQELAEQRAHEAAATKARLQKRIIWAVLAVVVASGSAWGLWTYVRTVKEAHARAEAKAKEAALLKEIEDLMSSVTIEPPLVALVDEPAEAPEPGAKRKRRAVARFSTGGTGAPVGGGTGELKRDEIMAGIARVFPGFKRCIVEQIQRDPESVPEQIVLSFSIDNEGVVRGVTLSERALRGTPIWDCMGTQMGQVRFRKFKGEVQNVEYPISIGRR
ncbi:AgmX/PglI C-terminal domain-containing protein [Myxococcota bacterium]|nr:AgmX/PglI C-terminal domain-containing protein [Myxococcota bacterium]